MNPSSGLSGDLTSFASPHAQRLLQLNVAAEKVLFLNQLQLAVSQDLEKVREALGAYRRGEAGGCANTGLPSGSKRSISSSKRSSSSSMGEPCGLLDDWYLLGETFLAVDAEQAATFLWQASSHRDRLERRRSRLHQERREALRALLALSPSAEEIANSDWAFLLSSRDKSKEGDADDSSDGED
ncbi:hypothetical protein Esti_004627 [Eimeria stiedai]